ncbi:MAG TPA: hypothetical protein VGR02_14265 [Thermoanaerobaculia bacterium]|jgi:hypothetical protein|nr:hypothetical protein [Thermoanaerobaculia bacterium]
MKTLIALIAGVLALPSAAFAQGLKGEYYSNFGVYPRIPDLPRLVRIDTGINFSDDPAHPGAAFNLPSSIVRNLNTARWTGSFVAGAGRHRFTIETDNAAVLSVDGNVLVDLRANLGYVLRSGEVDLDAGPHFVELYYVRSGQLGLIHMTLLRLPVTAIALSGFSPSPTYPAAYRSHSRTLDFEAPVAGGPYVVDQYAATEGVHFVPLLSDLGFPSRPMIREVAPIEASSGTHVIYNDSRDPIESTTASARVPLTIRFDRPLLRVSLKTGALQAQPGLPMPTAILRAFNTAGQLLGADIRTALPLPVRAPLEVARGTADIASISLDFGDHVNAETLDDLRVETTEGAPAACTPALPQVAFVEPAPDQDFAAGNGQVAAKFVVRESCGTLARTALLSGLASGTVTSTTHPGCTPPGCFAFQGSIILPPGTVFLRATATNSDGGFSNAVLRVRVRGARIHVTGDSGENIAGAQVFVNGTLATSVSGTNVTGPDGILEMNTPLRAGSRIVARLFLFENSSPRRGHERGSTGTPPRNWNYRVYNTSIFADAEGQFAPFIVRDPSAFQEITISRSNTLFGLHVVATIEWDASAADLVFFRDQKLLPASRYLFNATDGQMFFEQIDILDDGENWADTDYRLFADNTVHPYVSSRLGGFLGGGVLATHMNMRALAAASGVNDLGYSDFQVYAHEFGHYGLGLYDEYEGWADAHCTDLGRASGSGPYNANMPRASCMMWHQWTGTKICSSHPDNPHAWVNYQGTLNRTDCWNTIVANYGKDFAERSGHAPFFRFGIRTPATRGAVPGPIADLPVSGWAPTVTLVNTPHTGLCMPITIASVNGDGTARSGANVWFTTTYGARINAGQTGTDGTLMVRGLHVGDTFDSNPPLTVTAADCTPTM